MFRFGVHKNIYFAATRWICHAKGEVVSASHNTNAQLSSAYQYDGIGNRQKAVSGSTDLNASGAVNYTANAKNQYSSVGSNNLTYDADGNLTADGTKQYVWDSEHRLIEVKQSNGTSLATYTYDYLSRRIGRNVAGQNAESWIYDGWNPIAEYAGNSLRKTYTWGQDLSGSQQGAGGVGGLLSVKVLSATQPSSFSVLYDGNGNVSEYLDNTGATAAQFEYDAFGKTIVKTGPKANDFEHQFSTKPLDATSGLHYYGYRHYDANSGRWINRDPIEEEGGYNLYGFVGNDGVDKWDVLGLDIVAPPENFIGKVGDCKEITLREFWLLQKKWGANPTADEMMDSAFGCIGICHASQDPSNKKDALPENFPETKCWAGEDGKKKAEEATKKCSDGKSALVWSKAGKWQRNAPKDGDEVANDSVTENNRPGDFNYVTKLGGYYVDMENNAWKGGKTPKRPLPSDVDWSTKVRICKGKPAKESRPAVIWCMTCCSDNDLKGYNGGYE